MSTTAIHNEVRKHIAAKSTADLVEMLEISNDRASERVFTTARTFRGERGEVRLINHAECLVVFDNGDSAWLPNEEVESDPQ